MIYVFDDDYELDLQRYELRYAGKLVRVEPQVFNVLVYLVQHRDRVVSKEELLEQLWPGRFVGESVLTSRLMAARKAVGDSGRRQRIIQTLHGRGYRFVAPVEERGGEPSSEAEGDGPSSPHSQGGLWHDLPPAPGEPPVRDRPILLAGDDARSATPAIPGVGQVVGRRAELVQLLHWLQRALTGTRQVGFVTGEAGLGKTTLVEAFIAELGAYGTLWIGRGQCLEHYGAGEAYRPVLEAFGRLCHEPEGQKLLALLVHQAPTWVVQMPWLVSDAELERLQRRVLGVTRERMLREMAEAIEVLTAAHPLVLILEDLHWSDASTLALVASLARRLESARLLLLGTYRPAEALHQNHPLQALKHELQLHRHCEELPRASAAPLSQYPAGARGSPGVWPRPPRQYLVVSRLSRPGAAAEPGGNHPRPRARASLQFSHGPHLCGRPPSTPQGREQDSHVG
jgi:DNA-binding winged helix-turn-helix (wHTH) protein